MQKLFKLDKKLGANQNCVSLYTENSSQFLNNKHFGHKAVKLAFALFQHAEILAEILRIQRICVTKMLANRGRRIFTLMQIQHNPHHTGHIQISGSQLSWLCFTQLKFLFDLVADKYGLDGRMNLLVQIFELIAENAGRDLIFV